MRACRRWPCWTADLATAAALLAGAWPRQAPALTLTLALALAQPYPNRPIKIVVPFPVGGITDEVARLVGQRMAKSMGQPVRVENKSRAGGAIGANAAAKAPANGYPLLMHKLSLLLSSVAQILAKRSPFKGAAPLKPALLSGRIRVGGDQLTSSLVEIRAGSLRVLAATASKRNTLLPDLPTVRELGFASLELVGWNGNFVPAKTPKDIVERLRCEIAAALRHPEVAKRLIERGADPVGSSSGKWTMAAPSAGRGCARSGLRFQSVTSCPRPSRHFGDGAVQVSSTRDSDRHAAPPSAGRRPEPENDHVDEPPDWPARPAGSATRYRLERNPALRRGSIATARPVNFAQPRGHRLHSLCPPSLRKLLSLWPGIALRDAAERGDMKMLDLRDHLEPPTAERRADLAALPAQPTAISLSASPFAAAHRAYAGPERRSAADLHQQRMAQMLDALDYGMLLLDATLAVNHANRAAHHQLDDAHPLQLRGNQLQARHVADVQPLQEALIGATRRGLRRLLQLGSAQHRVAVAVVPLPANGADRPSGVTLLLGKRQVCEELTVDWFARSQGLTPAETAVIKGLCADLTPQQIAQRQGVGLATIRSQIGSIRLKTGAGSIRALVQQVALLPPLVGLLQGSPAGVGRRLHS